MQLLEKSNRLKNSYSSKRYKRFSTVYSLKKKKGEKDGIMRKEEQYSFKAIKDMYKSEVYDTKPRFTSYYNQIRLIRELNIKSILEVGVGTGFLATYLKREGFKVKTADVIKELNPDYVIDLRKDFSLPENRFDAIAAFEALEHVPFEKFKDALIRFRNASKKFVIISIPVQFTCFQMIVRVPVWNKGFELFIPIQRKWSTRNWGESQHYWEAGTKDFPLERIRKEINKSGLKIIKEYVAPENPHHYFFIMKKSL